MFTIYSALKSGVYYRNFLFSKLSFFMNINFMVKSHTQKDLSRTYIWHLTFFSIKAYLNNIQGHLKNTHYVNISKTSITLFQNINIKGWNIWVCAYSDLIYETNLWTSLLKTKEVL